MRLTIEQEAILLRLCNAAEQGNALRLSYSNKNRETVTGCALVRKGLATRLQSGRFATTLEGYWMGDALRIKARQRAS